jgi:acyl dehydratase
MGTGKFVTVYPGVWTEREKPYAEEYYAKIKELEDRGPIDVQALISGKIEKGTQGFSNVLEVKEDMMLYNAKKYDPDNKLYTDDEYARSLGFAGKIAMPAFGAHDDSFLTAFNGKGRDFLAVTGLHHEIDQLGPVYAGDTLYLVKDKLEMIDLTPEAGSIYRNLVLKCTGSVYNQKGEKVLGVMFSARENLKSYEDPADMGDQRGWESPDWWTRPEHYYTDEEWQQIFDTWAKEDYRGDKILYWEDVNVGDMPNVTIDGPIHASCNPTPPYGMAVGGSRTMKELADPEIRAKMTRDPKFGVYVPEDMTQWDPEVPPYDDPRAKMGPPPGAGGPPPKEVKRSIFINFLGRDFAIHHINNWMGTHGWIQNIRWGIMTNPTEQGFAFPKNTAVREMIEKIPAMQGKKCNTHGLQYDVMKIHSQVYDKYEKDGEHFVELGFWITTLNDDEIYEEGGATIKLPSRNT